MKLEDFLYHTSEWLKGTGPNANIVLSSRVRLARNLDKTPFPHWQSKKKSEETLKRIIEAISDIGLLKNTLILYLSEIDNFDKQILIERHLMSREHALKSNSKAVVIDPEEIISIMVNEEDHLRIQVMQSGFNLNSAWQIINQIDNSLAEKLPFAFLSDWGYLTSCPTNTGTGMRGSVMLHLVGLVITQQIDKVLNAIVKLGLTVRGLYGEGTQALGNFFQISNQYSLGRREDEIVDNINGVIRQIIEQEQLARKMLLNNHLTMLKDRIWRAYGVLKNSYLISSQETIELLSMVRLGIDLNIISDIDIRSVNELFILTQPAHLQKIEHKKLSSKERDQKRAQLIREKMLGGSK